VGEVALTRSARFSSDAGKILLTAFLSFVFLSGAQGRQQSANNSKKSDSPSGIISGHVYGADTGAPLAKAVVSLEVIGNFQTSESVETAADGVFRFAGLEPGKYQISVERCGYISEPRADGGMTFSDSDNSVSITSGEKREGFDFRLTRGGVISGSVTDEDNEPVPGLIVQALPFPYEPGGNHVMYGIAGSAATTDDLGNFRLIGLSAGSYYVYVNSIGQRWGRQRTVEYRDVYYPEADSQRDAQRVRVNSSAETPGIHVTVRLTRSFNIHGHVQGSCKGLAETSCMLLAFRANTPTVGPGANSAADEDGSFELSGLAPGEYAVKAIAIRQANTDAAQTPLGMGSTRIQIIDRDAEGDVSVGPLGQISGTVVDESSKPIQPRGMVIVIRQIGADETDGIDTQMFIGGNSEARPVDAKGHFEVNGIEGGTYVLELAAARGQEFVNQAQQSNALASDDPDTMYLKEFVCAGRDYARRAFELSSSTQLTDCKVKLGHDTASINGKVMDGDKGVAGELVVAIPESPELRRNPRYTLTGRTNRDGQFSITGIIPGDYLIFAVTPNVEQSYYALDFAERNPSAAERATFRPGETKTFVLKPSSAQ
jgi:protocatechuate 3,4-dioxygenase beta subunit